MPKLLLNYTSGPSEGKRNYKNLSPAARLARRPETHLFPRPICPTVRHRTSAAFVRWFPSHNL